MDQWTTDNNGENQECYSSKKYMGTAVQTVCQLYLPVFPGPVDDVSIKDNYEAELPGH